MSKFFGILPFFLLLGCAQPGAEITVRNNNSEDILIRPVRLEVYLIEATQSLDCARVWDFTNLQLEMENFHVFNSLSEFETNGYASIQIDNITSSKKMLLLVFAKNPTSNEIIGKACLDNVEVEKNTLRDVHLVLTPPSSKDQE